MHRQVLAAIAIGALLPAFFGAPAGADHSWGPYHWERTANPFTVTLGDNVDERWDEHLSDASKDWSFSDVLDASVVPGATSPRTCKAVSGRVEVCNARYGFNGWLGVAGIYAKGGHITAGYVKLNDSYFDTSTYGTPAWRQLVMCQEIGHTFGLDHQDESFDPPNLGTCMDYTNDPSTNQHPNTHDYEQLAVIYNDHADSVSGGGGKPGRGKGNGNNAETYPPAGGSESSWGRRVDGSRAAGHSTYVLDLGSGRSMVTFVTWAR